MVLTESYQELGRSDTYAFSDKGQVCVVLYGRMVDATTVAVKLTRIISGVSGVGYAYSSAQATLSGSLTHDWRGGASGMVYVGEHTVFEQTFAVAAGVTLSLSVIYDDSYITARTLSAVCQAAGQVPSTPTVTEVVFDPSFPCCHTNVTLRWTCEGADRYRVSICRETADAYEILYEADVFEKGVTFGLAGLPLDVGDELFFAVHGYNAAGRSDTGFSENYRLHPTVWVYADGWRLGMPWVRQGGVWVPACGLYVKDGAWR